MDIDLNLSIKVFKYITLSPWIWTLVFIIVGVAFAAVGEPRVLTALVFKVGDEVPEGSRLVIVLEWRHDCFLLVCLFFVLLMKCRFL